MRKIRTKIIFVLMYLAYMSIYLARINLSMAGTELTRMEIADASQIGLLGSAFSTMFAIGRLVNGSLGDYTPPWKMISIGLAAAGICNILIGFFPPFIGIILLWTVNAYAQSMLWSSILFAVTTLYDEKKAKLRMSVMITSVATGNIVGIIANMYFITKLGVRYAFLIPGIITIILGAVAFVMLKGINTPNIKKSMNLIEKLRSRELRVMCVPAALHGIMKENISLWMAIYIVDVYSVNLKASAYYILLIPVIGFAARMAYPIFLRIFKGNENAVSQMFFVICACVSSLVCFSQIGMLLSVIALGVIYAAVSIINTSLLSIYPLRYTNGRQLCRSERYPGFCNVFWCGGFECDLRHYNKTFWIFADVYIMGCYFALFNNGSAYYRQKER